MRRGIRLKVKMKEYEMLDGSMKTLVQQISDGSIVKRFERTPLPKRETDVVCPHFVELKWAYGCPFDCAWCYLKGTLRLLPTGTRPVVKDFDKVKKHLLAFFEHNGEDEVLNTGELADSLMWESVPDPFSRFVIPMFEAQKRHKVLFLTKSARVSNLLDIQQHSNTIMSFSMNAESVSSRWERAPGLQDRIRAAGKVYDAGYETRIRIDPIVPVSDWKEQYCSLIDSIFDRFVPERITLGTLRGLQSTVRKAKDKSWTEYISEKSGWGRRTCSDLRKEVYMTLMGHLSQQHNYDKVALCKETLSMWDSLGMDYTFIRCNCIW
ncbi:MAG: hypothetical protein E3J35_01915 [Methanomassiliicoccales archaeon]|nr:MAG: hypothetical protein E3J35_01915 [Methanomassiliicoccales archaeon]